MNYISTKQAAELWGISPRRIALLASDGRIEGARFMCNTWLIPENAQKPADNRYREQRKHSDRKKQEKHPYIIYSLHSTEQPNKFTAEEKELCRACMLYEEGEISSAREIAEGLRSSGELNIRLGALNLLAFSCMYQFDYASAEQFFVLLLDEYYGISEPSPVVKLFFAGYLSEIGRASEFMDLVDSIDPSQLPRDMLPCFSGQKLYSEAVKFGLGGKQIDLSPYETLCTLIEADRYHYSAMVIHLSLAVYYALLNKRDKECAHLGSAVELCIRHRFYFTLSCMTSPNAESTEEIFKKFSPEERARMKKLNADFNHARIEYAENIKKHSPLSSFSESDYRLVFCCLRGYPIARTAKVLGLSVSGTNKRLTKLYNKLGVDSMKDMKKVYLDSVLEWGKQEDFPMLRNRCQKTFLDSSTEDAAESIKEPGNRPLD